MTMHQGTISLVVCLVAGPLMSADPSPADIDRLIAELGSPRFAERQSAERRLATIGEKALPALKAAINNQDPERRTRIARLIPQIETAVWSEKLLKPELIEFNFDRVPLKDAVAKVNGATGLSMEIAKELVKNANRPVTVRTGKKPYWTAVEEFLTAANLVEHDSASQGRNDRNNVIGFQVPGVPGANVQPGSTMLIGSHFFLKDGRRGQSIATAEAMRMRVLPHDFAGHRYHPDGSLQLMVEVLRSTKVDVVGVSGIDVRTAVAADGTVLRAEGRGMIGSMNAQYFPRVQGQILVQLEEDEAVANSGRNGMIAIDLKGRKYPSLKELSGVIGVSLRTPFEESARVPGVLVRPAKMDVDLGDLQINLREVRTNRETICVVELDVHRLPVVDSDGDFVPFHHGSRFGGSQAAETFQVVLLDGAGKPMRVVQRDSSFRFHPADVDEVGLMVERLKLVFQKPKSDLDKAVLVVRGRRVIHTTVPFSLKDVRLP